MYAAVQVCIYNCEVDQVLLFDTHFEAIDFVNNHEYNNEDERDSSKWSIIQIEKK